MSDTRAGSAALQPSEVIARAQADSAAAGTWTKALGGTIATALASAGQQISDKHVAGAVMVWASPCVAIILPVIFDSLRRYLIARDNALKAKRDDLDYELARQRVVAMINTPGISESRKIELQERLADADLAHANQLLMRGLDQSKASDS